MTIIAGRVEEKHTKSSLGLRMDKLVSDSAGATLYEHELARGVDAVPLLLQAHGPGGVVDGGVEEGRGDAAGERRGRVILRADDEYVLAVGTGDLDLPGLVEDEGEGLDKGVHLAAETGLGALEDEVY